MFVVEAAMATFGWMDVNQKVGLDGLKELYPAACKGELPPSLGLVIKM
jgi:hypothetical protein